MTIRELLNKINDEKPHSFPESKIIDFLNEVEPEVAEQLKIVDVPVYTDDPSELDTKLLAAEPYDRLYISYVKARIDYANEEFDAYENDIAQHNQEFRDYTDWIVREGKAAKELGSKGMRFKHVF